jgi:FMN reductase
VFAAAEDWGAGESLSQGLAERIDRAARELAALILARPQSEPVDRFALTESFETLLHRV